MFCPWCGTDNPEGAAVCRNCGRALAPVPGAQGTPPAVPAPPAQAIPQGFFARLFDFSFRGFITPTIVSILYGILIVLAGLATLFVIISAFQARAWVGILALILSPFYFFLLVIAARLYLEIVVVLFRIAQDVGEIARRK
ncbi:MAG: DUF4282 domain-containing protein [Chloroflexia bacterium]